MGEPPNHGIVGERVGVGDLGENAAGVVDVARRGGSAEGEDFA